MVTTLGLGQETKRLSVLVIAPALIASVTIGVLRPLIALAKGKALKLKIRFEQRWTTDEIAHADVVIFCRNQSNDALTALYIAKDLGKRVIYELDDNLFEIPLHSALGRSHRYASMLHVIRRFFEMSDVTRVYTPLMVDLAEAFGANIHKIKSYFDERIIKGSVPQEPNKLKIALATGRTPDPKLDAAVEQALLSILNKRPGKIEVHFWRKPSRQLANHPAVVINTPIANYEKFIRKFFRAGYAIGIAPLAQTRFQESKTNNKYREYGGCGVAGIYSKSQPYNESVVDGETGLLVDESAEAWEAALLRLIDDAALRAQIATKAREHVRLEYGFDQALEAWSVSLDMAFEAAKRPVLAKPFLHARNIVTDGSRLGSSVSQIVSFPSTYVRGKDWNGLAVYPTKVVNSIDSPQMLAIHGAKTIMFITGARRLNMRALLDAKDADIVLVVDARRADRESILQLLQKVREAGLKTLILLLPSDKADIAGISADFAKLRTEHEFFPHEITVETDFGRAVITRIYHYAFEDFTLLSRQSVWLSVLDAASILCPKGRKPEKEHWLLRIAPIFIRRILHSRLLHKDLAAAVKITVSAMRNALRYRFWKFLVPVEAANDAVVRRVLDLSKQERIDK